MSDIAPVSGASCERIEPLGSPVRTPPPHPSEAFAPGRSSDRPSDRVDISDRARLLSRLAALPIRHELVDRVRREIAAGTYESEERLRGAIAALEEDLA
jgi:negative regulator of flagellin synthesis FlgM